MFNKGKFESLQAQVDKLKIEIYGPEEKKESKGLSFYDRFFGMGMFEHFYTRYTLKQKVDDLQKILKQQEKLNHLILEHFGLEYVKITEENGDKSVVEKLRPITKNKMEEKKKTGDCECCNYAD